MYINGTFSWTQPLIYIKQEGDKILNLADAVSIKGRVPYNTPEHPGHDQTSWNTMDRIKWLDIFHFLG